MPLHQKCRKKLWNRFALERYFHFESYNLKKSFAYREDNAGSYGIIYTLYLRSTYYFLLMWLKRVFMYQTVPLLYVLTCQRQFVATSNHVDELVKMTPSLSWCLRGEVKASCLVFLFLHIIIIDYICCIIFKS